MQVIKLKRKTMLGNNNVFKKGKFLDILLILLILTVHILVILFTRMEVTYTKLITHVHSNAMLILYATYSVREF